MVLQQTQTMTVEEFDRFAALPENADRLLEYIGGEIVEVVSNNYSSEIGMLVGGLLTVFVKQKKLGRVTGADGGYRVSGERYIPDAAFTSKAKQPKPSHEAYNPIPPDLAIEVWSPGNKEDEMAIKIANYLAAGTRVWLFKPLEQQAFIFIPGQPVKRFGIDGVLEDSDLLPGFKLVVKDIFDSEDK